MLESKGALEGGISVARSSAKRRHTMTRRGQKRTADRSHIARGYRR
jgi:hypothetical protein